MERSVIRVRSTSFTATPGFRFAHPGYKTLYDLLPAIKEGKRNAGRRGIPRPVRKRRTGRATEKAAYAALPLRARSPAGVPPRRLRQRPNATAQLQLTHFLGRSYGGMGVTHPRPSRCSGRCSPQAGRRAGRAFPTRSRPGAGLTTPPAGTALAPTNRRHPAGVLLGECHRMYLYRGPMSISR